MQFLKWKEVDGSSIVFIGLASGYVMAILGLWLGRIPGLVSIDIADFGRRYIVSDRPSAWFFGMLSHLANSILFVAFWAMGIVPNLDLPILFSGLVWAVTLAIFLAGSFVAPMSGMGIFGRKTGSHRFALTNLILHLVWGIMIGALYTPP